MESVGLTAKNKPTSVRAGRRAFYVFLDESQTPPPPAELLKEARECKRSLVVIDLSGVDSAATPTLEWIEQVTAGAEAEGLRVRVVARKGSRVMRLLEILRFTRFVMVLGSLREALKFGRARTEP